MRRTTDSTNELYKPIATVVIAGTDFSIYGSMSWTVAETRKMPWEVVRRAYIELTGDTRDDVNVDAAINVVCGHLQFTWAELKGRQDLLPTLTDNQKRRIEMALTSTQPVPKERGKRQPKERPQHTPGAGMSDNEAPAQEEGATAGEGTGGEKTIPTRGAMGKAAELIKAGETDGAKVEEGVVAAFPNVKNAKRHIAYVARLLGVKLTYPAKVPDTSLPVEPPTAPPEEAPVPAST